MAKGFAQSLDEDGSLSQLLELATAEPDEALLRRYAQSSDGRGGIEGQLTPAELRWIETNLRVNPLWKRRWRQIQKDCRHARTSMFVRGAILGACIWSVASLFWIETVNDVRTTMHPEVAAVLQGSPTALRSADEIDKQRNPDLVVDGAWTLLPTTRFNGLTELLVDLEQDYQTTRDPFKKAELAYRIAGLNELAGRIAVALEWYELCEEARSAEYSEQVTAALDRLRARLPASYRIK